MTELASIGLVGVGYGAAVLAPAFAMDQRARLHAVAASRIERADVAAKNLGAVHSYADWRALIDNPLVTTVAIAAPPILQAKIATAALEAGKPVFVEKPLAATADEARALRDLAHRIGLPAMLDLNFREIPQVAAARALLQAGAIGPLRHVAIGWQVENVVNKKRLDHWKARVEDGGGALGNFVSHSLDLIPWLFGPINSLQAKLARIPGDARSGESFVNLAFELEGGAVGALTMSSGAYAGSGHRIEAYGEDGALVLENPGPSHMRGFVLKTIGRGDAEWQKIDAGAWPISEGDERIFPTSRLAARFLDWIEGGAPAQPNFDDGLAIQRLIELARRSDREGVRLQAAR